MRFAVALVLLAACTGSGTDPDLEPTAQGVCSNLEPAVCLADARCQLAYEDSGFQPQPFPMHCLELASGPPSTAACAELDHDACRARPDCSPMFWQELGPDDGPVGDPYYKRCASEADAGTPQ